jgi:hypothetical protein
MTCEQARALVAESLNSEHDPAVNFELESHILDCPVCSMELTEVRKLWNQLDLLPDAEPSAEVRPRFYQMLEAYQQGRSEAKREKRSWFSWWPQQPVWQMGLSFAMLAIGVFAGYLWTARETKPADVAQLRNEVDTMRQLVTLSLLQQQSASDRLKGVNWAYRVEQSDTEVLSALLKTVNQDPNVNVRLAAVDALRNFGQSPVTRKALVQSLPKQSSPMVEIALIDLLVELKEKPSVPALQSLLGKTDLDPNVRQRLGSALRELQ